MITLTDNTLTISTPEDAMRLYRAEQYRERDSIEIGMVCKRCGTLVNEGDICSRCKEGCVPEINQ